MYTEAQTAIMAEESEGTSGFRSYLQDAFSQIDQLNESYLAREAHMGIRHVKEAL